MLLAIACLCLVVACGHSTASSSSPNTPVTPVTPATETSAAVVSSAAAPPAATLGCGTYCQQAGNSAGDQPEGYPCPTGGCLKCPPQNCVSVESRSATVTNGVATVKLTCNLSTECKGAFLICLPALCQVGRTEAGGGGRLAGSDFVVPANTTSDVAVGLTDVGKQLVSGPGGFGAGIIVDLLDYGPVINTTGSHTGSFELTSTDPPALPPGATASCGGVVFVGPNTSCPFAQNVFKAYSNFDVSANGTLTVVSPVTGKRYTMQCTAGSPVVCRGGTNAIVEFYT